MGTISNQSAIYLRISKDRNDAFRSYVHYFQLKRREMVFPCGRSYIFSEVINTVGSNPSCSKFFFCRRNAAPGITIRGIPHAVAQNTDRFEEQHIGYCFWDVMQLFCHSPVFHVWPPLPVWVGGGEGGYDPSLAIPN